MNKDLAEMFRYNAWANRELFEACRSLTEEQLDMQIRGISGSVRELAQDVRFRADDGEVPIQVFQLLKFFRRGLLGRGCWSYRGIGRGRVRGRLGRILG